MRYGYLGPQATFTEIALGQVLAAAGHEGAARVPMLNVPAALGAVQEGELDGAVLPIENSLEGGVPATLDALGRHALQIVAETVVPVRFVLAVRPGTTLEEVRAFGTHPHAEAQTRGFVRGRLPGAEYFPTSSTAAAAEQLASGRADFQAAIGPALAAERFGLEVVAGDIGERDDAETRFVLVTRPGRLPEPTGSDKTTIVAGLRSDRAGALVELLEQFAARGVNLGRIESRPTGNGLGLYQFFIDAIGHIAEARVAEALAGVHRTARSVQFLGSYPSYAQPATVVDPLTSDLAFTTAAAWLDEIRGR